MEVVSSIVNANKNIVISFSVYIAPPLASRSGAIVSLAQLIKWRYASLFASGGLPSSGFDISSLIKAPRSGI